MAEQVDESFAGEFVGRSLNYIRTRKWLILHQFYFLFDSLEMTIDRFIEFNASQLYRSVDTCQIMIIVVGNLLSVRAVLLTPRGAVTNFTNTAEEIGSADLVLVAFGGLIYVLDRPWFGVPPSEYTIFASEEERHFLRRGRSISENYIVDRVGSGNLNKCTESIIV